MIEKPRQTITPRKRCDVSNGSSGSPFDGDPPGRGRRHVVHVWVMRKGVRAMTLSLRAAEGDRWETLFLLHGQLYQTQLFSTKMSVQRHVDQVRTHYWR